MPQSYYDQTSVLPFQAILEGRNDARKALEEMNPRATQVGLSVGVAAYLVPKLLAMIRG